MKKISVSLPVNITPDDAGLFNLQVTYEQPALKIKYLKGSFVTASGLVCGRKGLLKECYHYAFPDEFNERLNEVSHYYHSAKDNPENLITLDDDETYLLIHHTWHNNYYHWICETILRLWMVRRKTTDLILLLPAEDRLSPFAQPSLAPFEFKDVFHIPTGKSLLVRNLCMPQLKPVMASYIPKALAGLNKLYLNYIESTNKHDVYAGSRVYLSRKKSRRRKINNEDEVIELLSKYDFKVVYNEDYSFFEQVSLYTKVQYLVSIHGAGLVNMLFMPRNSTVFEFHKRQTNSTDHHSLIFWYMTDGLNHKYYHQICEPTDPTEDFFKADMIVDIALLKANMDAMFS